MPLVPAICTQCGAQIEVDDTHEAGVCKHCGTAFITEKAINNHITANTVNIFSGNSSDFVIRAGVLEKYTGESTNIVIPDNVTMIGEGAFYNCIGLSSVKISNNVTSIGDDWISASGAFENCKNLTSITIPTSVTAIGASTFNGCEKLTTITLPDSVAYLGHKVFEGCKSLASITIPKGVTSIGDSAFKGCESLTTITIPDGVTSISNFAFEGCKNLTSITIPKGVTSIGNSAFKGCKSLASITIPKGVTSIGDSAFGGCESLTTITIPDGAISIGYGAFLGCKKLVTITIPDSVTKVSLGLPHHDYVTKPFPDNPSLNIIASTEWKTNYYYVADCLEKYKPDPPKPKACYIATCVYGSYDCPQVWTLRRFRDFTLDETWYGRAFIRFYYAVSPTLVKWFGNQKWFKTFWKKSLDTLVYKLNKKGVENTKYTDKY